MITKGKFGKYDLYTLSNGELEVSVTTLGATWTSVKYLGEEMVTPYLTDEALLEGAGFLCKSVGRYANRIGGSAFDLEGKHYVLPANEGRNQLHGGPGSYDKRIWDAEILNGTDGQEAVKMSIFSPDGDCGFPGNLTMGLVFSLRGSTFHIEFLGETDAVTVYAPTVHPYFNLGRRGSVLDAELLMKASGHLDVDDELIPTGKILPCEGKFDFSSMKRIEKDFDDAFLCPEDHCCTLSMNGYAMEVWTDMPAVQVYSGAGMPAPYKPNDGIAIEPEYYPDSPNHADFPSTVLRPGEKFLKYVDYRFAKL